MWPYTSIEHYIDEKTFFENYVNQSKKINFILKSNFNKKLRYFKNISHVLCASKWQKKMVDKSPIFKHAKKIIIPLPIDFNLWKPTNKILSKTMLGFDKNIFTIFLPLSNRFAAKRKGLDLLISSLNRINDIKICLITTNTDKIFFEKKNILHKNIHNPKKPLELMKIYSATDLFAMPSRFESFGQTLLEAQACNCPAIIFKNTGCEDMILHKKNGYIAEYMNIKDLEAGIRWCVKRFRYKQKYNVRKHAQNLAKIRNAEKSRENTHTTTAMQGISPNITYRNSKGGKSKKTGYRSGTYPTSHRPRIDMTASRYGTARAPLPRHYELDSNPIFSLSDLLDQHEVSLEKHSRNVNRVRSAINEINDNFYDI